MRLDHVAYRVKDRYEAAKFFCDAFGYRLEEEFTIYFDDAKTKFAQSLWLVAPESPDGFETERIARREWYWGNKLEEVAFYHLPHDIFISDGPQGTVVGDWVAANNGHGLLHHMAFEVDDVALTMKAWKEKGWAEFTTDEPIESEDLVQCFTHPHPITGIVYEFIKRYKKGFSTENVRKLMLSTVARGAH